MLKRILLSVLIVGMLASCNSRTALQYNEGIVKKEKALEPEIEKTENNVERYVNQGQFDSIGVAGERMEKLVDDALKKIVDEPAPDVERGTEFKSSVVVYFKYLKSIYTSYKKFGYAPTDEERERERTNMLAIIGNKQTVIKDMTDAQTRFAKANGFKMESGK